MSEKNNKSEFPIDWKSLDDIIRQWAVMSQWQNDQDNYEKLKSSIEENVFSYTN